MPKIVDFIIIVDYSSADGREIFQRSLWPSPFLVPVTSGSPCMMISTSFSFAMNISFFEDADALLIACFSNAQ